VNEQIRAREILVIGDDGQQFGVMQPFQALQKAREAGLDLVEVAPTATPPVCRIMDYGRYRYLATKREREGRKGQKASTVREIRFRVRIAEHDRMAKIKRIREFLNEGNKVKLSVMFRGREITHPDLGVALLRGVVAGLKDEAKVEVPPIMEGRFLNLLVSPVAKRDIRVARPPKEGDAQSAKKEDAEQVQAQDAQGRRQPASPDGERQADAAQGAAKPPAASAVGSGQAHVREEASGHN
jgi:translation initiation factor IF-3